MLIGDGDYHVVASFRGWMVEGHEDARPPGVRPYLYRNGGIWLRQFRPSGVLAHGPCNAHERSVI